MRVLFTILPAYSNFHALVPIARALQELDHDVLVATSRSFVPVVEAAGLPAAEAGLDWLESDPGSTFSEASGLDAQDLGVFLGRVFDYHHPRAMIDDVRTLIRDWQPDVVAHTQMERGGQLAAELEGIPWSVVAYMLLDLHFPALVPDDPDEQKLYLEITQGRLSIHGLRAELGLPPAPDPHLNPGLAHRYLTLDLIPPSMHFFVPRAISRTAWPIRPESYSTPIEESAGAWIDELPADGQLVLVSLGTVLRGSAELLTTVVEGLEDLVEQRNATLVIQTGAPAADIGPLPPRVRLVSYVPHDRLIPRCELVVTHGGQGTIMAALNAGVPLLVLPQFGDQPRNAAAVSSVGAGAYLAGLDVTAEQISKRATEIVENRLFKVNAVRMRREIAGMPPPAAAAGLLARLAQTRRPLRAPSPFAPLRPPSGTRRPSFAPHSP